MTVRISQINWCAFCVDINSATLLKRGVAAEKIHALVDWRDCNLFDDRERAALDYAEAVTRSDREVADRHIAALRAHFDDDAIVELTGLIAFQNMSSKFNSALDVPAQGFCEIPVRSAAASDDDVVDAASAARRAAKSRVLQPSTHLVDNTRA